MTIDTQKLREYAAIVSFDSDDVNSLLDHIDALEADNKQLREALSQIESLGGESTSGDGHARCREMARAALSGEGKC